MSPLPKKKRILVVAPTPFFTDRGTPIRILEEIRAMVARGYHIDVLTYPLGDRPESLPDSVRIFRCLNITPWYKKRDAGPSIEKLLLDGAMQFSLTRLRITERYDVIHAHLHEGVAIAEKTQVISWLLGKRTLLIGDLHGSLYQEVHESDFVKSRLLLRFIALAERWLERVPAVIVTSSEKNTERIKRDRTKKTITLLDGVLPTTHTLTKNEARKTLGIDDRGQYIAVYTGGFGKEKGIEFLMQTVEQSLSQHDALDWILAGNMTTEQHAEYTKRFGATGRVHLIKELSYTNLPVVLAAADFGIDPKPQNSEQASGKMMNYAGAGVIPVQLSSEPGLLEQLVRDAALREKKYAETQEFASTHSWEITTAPFIDIYENNHRPL